MAIAWPIPDNDGDFAFELRAEFIFAPLSEYETDCVMLGRICSRKREPMSHEAANRFSTEIQRSAEAALVTCHGALVSSTSNILQREVKELISGSAKIVLDLKDLTYIDSMGIGSLVRLYVSARSSGCSLQLINIGGRVQQVLGITNLLTVFGAAEDHNLPVH